MVGPPPYPGSASLVNVSDVREHRGVPRFLVPVLATAILLSGLLTGCAALKPPAFERYLDPAGRFSLTIPTDREIVTDPPDDLILSAVTFLPPEQAGGGATGGLGASVSTTGPEDQVVYRVVALDTAAISTGDIAPTAADLQQVVFEELPEATMISHESLPFMGAPADVAVIEFTEQDVTLSAAVATATRGSTGYIVHAVFAPDDWKNRKESFQRLLGSFRSESPPGLGALIPDESSASPSPAATIG